MKAPTQAVLTRIPDSWAWMAPDLIRRLLPFTVVVAVVEIAWRPSWLGFSAGGIGAAAALAAGGPPVLFLSGSFLCLLAARRRGALLAPAAGLGRPFPRGLSGLHRPLHA